MLSKITDAILETGAEWQNLPLEALYPLLFFDTLRVKIRNDELVRNKAVYVAFGVTPDGTKDTLGLWIETSKGSKFWLGVMNEVGLYWMRSAWSSSRVSSLIIISPQTATSAN